MRFRTIFQWAVTCMAVLLLLAVALGADHRDIKFQGLLSDSQGNPVADGSYNLIFSIWDDSTGGTQHWSQMQAVDVKGGLFSTTLQQPFEFLFTPVEEPMHGPFFIQTQVQGEADPLMPRVRLASVYGSMLTHRMDGDVFTSPGRFKMIPNGPPVSDCTYVPIELAVDSLVSRFRMKLFDPSIDCTYVPIVLEVNSNKTGIELHPPDPIQDPDVTAPAMTMLVDPTQAIYELFGIDPTPFSDANVSLSSDAFRTSLAMKHGATPPDDSQPQLSMRADTGAANLWVGNVDPTGASSWPYMNVHTNAGALLNLGYAFGTTPDDNSPPPDDGMPALMMMAAGERGSFDVYGSTPPDDSRPQAHMNADSGAANLWLGNVDQTGSSSWPYMNVHTNAGAMFGLGFASGIPPDDTSPPPDDNMSAFMLMADAGSSRLAMHGPPDGGGSFRRISMRADNTEARVGINTDAPTSALYVDGDIVATGAISEISDGRLKANVREIDDAMAIVQNIRGVKFEWRRDQTALADLPEGDRVGLVAQDVEAVLPEAVVSPEDGYKSVDYSRLTPVLIEALKAQQRQIDALQAQVDRLSQGAAKAEAAMQPH